MLTLNDIAIARIEGLLNEMILAIKEQNKAIKKLQSKVMKVKNMPCPMKGKLWLK